MGDFLELNIEIEVQRSMLGEITEAEWNKNNTQF